MATLALTGGFLALTAGMELVLAAFLFWFGGSHLHVALLLATVLAAALVTWAQIRRCRQWTDERLDLTDDLIERMVGHRTRLAQLERSRWHDGEDDALERYLGTSARLDWLSVLREVLVPRAWFIVALLGLAPAFVWGGRMSPVLVISVGGIVLVSQALRSLGEGLDQLVAAVVAWERVRLFWQAAALRQPAGHPHFFEGMRDEGRGMKEGMREEKRKNVSDSSRIPQPSSFIPRPSSLISFECPRAGVSPQQPR